MAMEQYLTDSIIHNQPLEDGSEDWKRSSPPTDVNSSGGFNCNICLETVEDPVVTICGHLYCWPCIYKWIHQQSISSEIPEDHHSQCPVCKAELSEKTLIPLYGRDQSMAGSDQKAVKLGPVIPERPRGPAYGIHTLVATSTSQDPVQQDSHHHHGYSSYPPLTISLGGITTFQPLMSMFGEVISTHPNSYGMAATGSTRARRHVMQADRSMSRFSFFLFCCMVLCLLLF